MPSCRARTGRFAVGLALPVLMCGLAACSGSPAREGASSPPEGMALVPGREFVMGTEAAELPAIVRRYDVPHISLVEAEAPTRTVRVDSFYLDVDDVTNAQFAEFVAARPEWSPDEVDPAVHDGEYLSHWTAAGPPADLDRPVTFVTWGASAAYCRWREARLPTEAEWELAAGGGEPGREFPWGVATPADSIVVWGGSGVERPEPVGSRPATLHGLQDMAGNVWKFLADAWPSDAEPRRAIRGGSFEAAAVNLRVRYRDSHRERDAAATVGFRCAAYR